MTRIAVIPGDGIGNEVVTEAVKVLEAVDELFHFGLEYELFDLGAERYLKTGQAIPDDFDQFIDGLPNRFDTALFGAGGTDPRVPPDQVASPVLRGLRRRLDLYANLRPCRLLDASLTPLKGKTEQDIDFVFFRENTEGYESGSAGTLKVGTSDEVEVRPEINTAKGVRRIIEYALSYAREHGRSRVDMAEKGLPNGLWARTFREVGKAYPEIDQHHVHVDTLAYAMVVSPEQLQVIVAENRAGDILSDIAGAIQGGRGISPTGCFNPDRHFCYFEPIHGTGPDIIGMQLANPIAAILAAKMLLEHSGHPEAAAAMEAAVAEAVRSGNTTPDLGGNLSTSQVGDFICRELRRQAD
jgi:3-isopropylmalate dehydrogenase